MDHFVNISNIRSIAMKRPSLDKILSKFMPKSIMRLTPEYCKAKHDKLHRLSNFHLFEEKFN